MPQVTQTRKITISVDTNGNTALKDLADKLGGLNKNTKALADGFGVLTRGMAAFLGGLGLRELVGFSDEIQTLNNRYLALTGNQTQASQTLSQLAQLARDTNGSLGATSDLYFKMSLALSQAHLSGASLQEIMGTLINSFRLSGSTADEAYSAVSSLALAFELGGLKGRELRTVLRQNQVLALALRKEFGSELFSAANNGFITVSKLIEVLYKNMGDINKRASLMTATFGQTLTKAFDAFKLKIFEVNQTLGGSAGFAEVMDGVIRNMGTLVTVGGILAIFTLPTIITQVYKLGVALLALNPATLALTGGLALGLAGVVAIFGDSGDIGQLIKQMKIGFLELKVIILDTFGAILEGLESVAVLPTLKDLFGGLADNMREAAKDAHAHAQELRIDLAIQEKMAALQNKTAQEAGRHAKDLNELNKAYRPDLDRRQLLAALNSEYRSGAIDVDEYNQRILKFDITAAQKEFRNGLKDLAALNEEFRKVKTIELNRQLRDGVLSFDEFDAAIRNVKLDKMNEDLAAGRISLEDFNLQLASVSNNFSANGAFRTGLQEYLSAIGTTTKQVADLIKDSFTKLEDVFVEFTKSGKFNFDKFTQAVLDDLTRIILRATIIQPIASGLLGFLSLPTTTSGPPGGGGGQYAVPPKFAKGGMFYDNVLPFARGDVVTSPTLFGYGNNKTGLMGEQGPEAIVPLKRGSGGELGIKASVTPVNINIINSNGSEVSQQETTGPNGEKTIDILITNKVREGMLTGRFDGVMKQSYGLNRRGS